jgi:hypothetical protein
MFASYRHSNGTRMSSLGTLARGVTASARGTLAMDSFLFRRYKREAGESKFRAWEFSAGLDSWKDAPAPAWLGKRLVEVLLRRELSPQHARRRASRSLLIPAGRDV